MDGLARQCSVYGLRWAAPRVGEFERGKIPATVPTLLVVAFSLRQLTNLWITLPDLVEHDGLIALAPSSALDAKLFRSALSGQAVDFMDDLAYEQERAEHDRQKDAAAIDNDIPPHVSIHKLQNLRNYAGLADERAAKRLGMSVDAFLAYCYLTYGAPLSEILTRDLPPDASPQARGHYTRKVLAFVQQYRESPFGRRDG